MRLVSCCLRRLACVKSAAVFPVGAPFDVGDARNIVLSPRGDHVYAGRRDGTIGVWRANGAPVENHLNFRLPSRRETGILPPCPEEKL